MCTSRSFPPSLSLSVLWIHRLIRIIYFFTSRFRGQSFRKELSKIGDVRSLIPENVCLMALTATATKTTRQHVISTLGMHKPVTVLQSPEKTNLRYSVKTKNRAEDMEVFAPLVEEIKKKRKLTDRTIIFCHTYDDTSFVYLYIRSHLENEFTEPPCAPDTPRYRLVDMFSACTHKDVKLFF